MTDANVIPMDGRFHFLPRIWARFLWQNAIDHKAALVEATMKTKTNPKRPLGQSALSAVEWTRVSQGLGLTSRETAVVRLVFDDEVDATIAMELGISAHTVNTHLANVFMKAGVHSRIQFVILVLVLCHG